MQEFWVFLAAVAVRLVEWERWQFIGGVVIGLLGLGVAVAPWKHVAWWPAIALWSLAFLLLVLAAIAEAAKRHSGMRGQLRIAKERETGRRGISQLLPLYEDLLRRMETEATANDPRLVRFSVACQYLLAGTVDVVRKRLGDSYVNELDSRAGLQLSRVPAPSLPPILQPEWERAAWAAERLADFLRRIP